MDYRPRRASKRWLAGAPEYILDVFDNKGKTADRYTILFGGTMLDTCLLRQRMVWMLGLSAQPTSPCGFSQWGEVSASYRPSRDRIRWADLPDNIKAHIVHRATGK